MLDRLAKDRLRNAMFFNGIGQTLPNRVPKVSVRFAT
jgi:hypothetical protein